MLSKILFCTMRGKWVFHKSHVFWWIIFFYKDSVNSLISICFSDLNDQKLPVSAIKIQIDNNRPKILLARPAHKWSRQLACSNYGPNRAIGRLLKSKPDSCEIISKSDQWFLRTRFFLHYTDMNFFTAPVHQSHIYRQIKILRTIFEKGHPRNISAKLFQNLTSIFGEKKGF